MAIVQDNLQPVLAGIHSQKQQDLRKYSFTAHMPLLMTAIALGLGTRC